MKTSKTLSVVVLLMAGIFSAPSVQAQQTREFRIAFTFNPADNAGKIYSDLQRTAREACKFSGTRLLALKKYEDTCARDVLNKGVQRLNRADVAALHNGVTQTVEARG